MENTKKTVPEIIAMKKREENIAALTAYDYLLGSILDQIGIDIILVGDSGAMVFAGHETTIPLTMDQQIYHCQCVRRGVQRALLVADMPFLSFQVNPEMALLNAGRFFKEAQVDAVKVEGGMELSETIKKITGAGIPMMGHLGLTPQSIRKFGTYSVQGKNEKSARKLLEDAIALEQAGVFAIVLEKIPIQLAKEVTAKISIPTIGIGAGPYCDGQILVTHDILGLYEKFKPKFVRRYAHLAEEIRTAGTNYIQDVKANKFPNDTESYTG